MKQGVGTPCGERGFSMVELMVAVGIIVIVTSMAITQMQPVLQETRANAGMDQVINIFRTARDYSVANRRYVQVSFPNYPGTGANQLQVTVLNHLTLNAGADQVLTLNVLNSNVTFQLFPGFPDTPDGFGSATAVNFEFVDGGPTAGMMFQPDGTFVDTTGAPVNGTVFLGITNFPATGRAVTVLGATGHVKSYFASPKGSTAAWIQAQ
ncbi:MAG: prepilin-type N-terminal cleavage/methylation domain-containing protein [Candidatus Acidiferrales bacterium]